MGYIEIIRPVRTAVARGPGARPRRGRRRRQGPTVDRFGAGWATGRGHERPVTVTFRLQVDGARLC